jgi:hypothetical protein
MERAGHSTLRAALVGLLVAGGGPAARPPQVTPPPAAEQKAPPVLDDGSTVPVTLRIKQLQVDPAKSVRIRGVISSILGVRMVPAMVIFKISDSSETITVVLNEQVQLKEGTEVELVGRYKELPSPLHNGPGEPPREAVFEVERFLDLR